MKKYKSFLNKQNTELTDKEFDYLVNFECKTSNFYGLPKIHKNKKIKEACPVATIRPIVDGPACETHRLSYLLDILLQPYIKYVESYIKDTKDFLLKLPKEIPNDSILMLGKLVVLCKNDLANTIVE